MDSDRDASRVGDESDEEGGGPVKSFLEHLEDLRWTLIKSIVTVLISMLVCMMASNYLIAILKWPLTHSVTHLVPKSWLPKSWLPKPQERKVLFIHLGTNFIGQIQASAIGLTNNPTSNEVVSLNIAPALIGTNLLLALHIDTEPFIPLSVPTIKAYGPMAPVMIALKLALYGGLIFAAPLLFYFIGQFVLPALHVHEKRILYQSVGFGVGLFVLGVLFAYFIITGVALLASVEVADWMGFAADEWRAEEYIEFVTKFLLGMGICFEIPVVILVLVKIGLLDHRKLSKFRSYAIVLNLIIGAVVTPSGDPFTMLLFAAPLHLLYEISVLIAWFWARRDRKRAEAAAKVIDI